MRWFKRCTCEWVRCPSRCLNGVHDYGGGLDGFSRDCEVCVNGTVRQPDPNCPKHGTGAT